MQLKLKSQHRHQVGKKIHKTQNIFPTTHTQSRMTSSFPTSTTEAGTINSSIMKINYFPGTPIITLSGDKYNEDKPLFLGHRLMFLLGKK